MEQFDKLSYRRHALAETVLKRRYNIVFVKVVHYVF